jgi:hypothetical protein
MTAVVERATGRAVAAFHSTIHLTHQLTLLIFMFAPAAPA